MFHYGDNVEWVRGAVGLTGRVVDFLHVPLAEEESARVLIDVVTERGRFYEYPCNLKRI